MRRKTGVLFITMLSIFGAIYAIRQNLLPMDLKAVSTPEYYGLDETFARTDSDTFKMGGLNWRIIYANATTGEGYIMAPNITKIYDCAGRDSSNYIKRDNVEACLTKGQTSYSAATSDADNDSIGRIIRSQNPGSATLGLMSLADYEIITNKEADITQLKKIVGGGTGETWLSEMYKGKRMLFWEKGSYLHGSYKNISEGASDETTLTYVNPCVKIKLPQKNFITSITADKTSMTSTYGHADIGKDQKIIDITTSKGEGPYEFTIYDTNASGTTSSVSSHFYLDSDQTNGTAKIKIKDAKLPAGDHYFKIQVIDKSTNDNLYIDSTDFTKDSYRTKETGILHVKVEKGTQDPLKVYENEADRLAGIHDVTSVSKDKMEDSISLYPAGGATELADSSIQYTIENDPSGVLTSSPASGTSGTFTLTHKAGTAKVKITKPGKDNYKDISITVEITITEVTEKPQIVATQSDGATTYISATKYNDDVNLTFQKPSGSSVTKDLKLKELKGVENPASDWYKTSGTETTISSGRTERITANDTKAYVCYWLYYDNYIDNGVGICVDVLKDKPKIKNPDKSSAWLIDNDSLAYKVNLTLDKATANHKLDDTKTKLYSRGSTATTYPLENISEGLYTLHLEDEYGNVDDVDFKVIASLYFVNPGTATKITELEKYYEKDGIIKVEAGGASTSGSIKYRIPTSNTVLKTTATGSEFEIIGTGNVDVEAYTEDASGNTLSTGTLKVTINKAKQTIKFVDTDTTKNITYDPAAPTLSLPANVTIDADMPNGGKTGDGKLSYTIGGADHDIATVDDFGTITIKGPITALKSFTVTAGVTGADHFETASALKTINVYPEGSATWKQDTTYPQAEVTAINAKIGNITSSGGVGTPEYSISTTVSDANIDAAFFSVDKNSGSVKLKTSVRAADLMSRTYNAAEHAYEMKVTIDIKKGDKTTSLPITIYMKGAPRDGLDFDERNDLTKEITKTYADGGTFYLTLNQTLSGTLITYELSSDPTNPSDVIEVDADGTVKILNANETSIDGSTTKPAIVFANIPAAIGYEETILEAPVRIKRAEQKLEFAQNPINTTSDVGSLNVKVNGHKDGSTLVYSSDVAKVKVEADPLDNEQVIIHPNGQIINNVKITVMSTKGNRNYKAANGEAILNIAKADEKLFAVIFPSMMYGDSGSFTVTTITDGDGSETYTYTVKDTSVFDIDASGNITIHGAGSTQVDVIQTSSRGSVGPYTYTVDVDPKELTLTIQDEAIYTGEAFPTYTFQDPPLGSFVGSDGIADFLMPKNTSAKQGSDLLSDTNTAGAYNIVGSYTDAEFVGIMKNYDITIQKGTLTIKQDIPENSWFHLEDDKGNILDSGQWYSHDIHVVLDAASGSAGTYDQIAEKITFTNVDKTKFTVIKEEDTLADIYFRIDPTGSDPHKGAISAKVQTHIKIDKTDPVIQSITGYPVNIDGLSDFLHQITLGHYFKPGVEVQMNVIDPTPTDTLQTSGIQEVRYEVFALDESGVLKNTTPIDDGKGLPDADGNMSFKINTVGNYRVCAIAEDHAGNMSKESCADLNVKKIDIDIDGDDIPDFNDPDGDGCPDLNIILGTDANGDVIKLNVAKKGEEKPYLNIDTDGDGFADINIDTDKDGKPDLNLALITSWNPKKCVTGQKEAYCTDVSIIPTINVVTEGNPADTAIPDVNIDTDGDFKPDLNITDTTGKPYLNIVKLHEWKPNKDFTYDSFLYDTIEKEGIIIERNQDSDGDGLPDINLDIDGDGTPDLNIDTDYDGIPDLNIDSDGDGKPDLNIDVSGNGYPEENIYTLTEWKPDLDNKKVNGFTFDTMEIKGNSELEDQGIKVEKPDGTFLPNYAIRVTDTTDSAKENVQKEAGSLIDEKQEIVSVYDVKLLVNDTETKPDGTIRVKLPIPEGSKNPQVLVKKSNGTYEKVEASVEGGYLIYETDELGEVSILSDKSEDKEPPTKPSEDETPQPTDPTKEPSDSEKKQPQTSVQGSYTGVANGIGGANTADTTQTSLYIFLGVISLSIMYCLYKKNA